MTSQEFWVGDSVAALLQETFAMIPRVAGDDKRMELWLHAREPMMLSYTRKMWTGMQASSQLDYCIKAERLYSSILTIMPASVLACSSQKELDTLLMYKVSALLKVSFTEDELEGKAALTMLSGSIQALLAPHVAKLRESK